MLESNPNFSNAEFTEEISVMLEVPVLDPARLVSWSRPGISDSNSELLLPVSLLCAKDRRLPTPPAACVSETGNWLVT